MYEQSHRKQGSGSQVPVTEAACPELLVSVMLVDNSFLVEVWPPSAILLMKWDWLSNSSCQEPSIMILSESPSIATGFSFLLDLPFQGTGFLTASIYAYTQLHLYSYSYGCMFPLSTFSTHILGHSLSCCHVCWLPGTQQAKKEINSAFCNFCNLVFCDYIFVIFLDVSKYSLSLPFFNYKFNKTNSI